MFTTQTRDLYHIEFDQRENISNLPQGKYIELSGAKHIDKMIFAFVSTNAVLVNKNDILFSPVCIAKALFLLRKVKSALWMVPFGAPAIKQVRVDINPLRDFRYVADAT